MVDSTDTGSLPATTQGLRVALFSGNYNYVRDGANQALNRLVGYLQRQGAQVRVYAPKVANPAFPSKASWSGCLPSPFPAARNTACQSRSARVCGAIWPRSRRMWSTFPRPTSPATAR
jgi:hypothetical protein